MSDAHFFLVSQTFQDFRQDWIVQLLYTCLYHTCDCRLDSYGLRRLKGVIRGLEPARRVNEHGQAIGH